MKKYNALWSRPGQRLVGLGTKTVLDPGVGSERYSRALEMLRVTDSDLAFASFTFDPDQSGSVVVVPESISTEFDSPQETSVGTLSDANDIEWSDLVERALMSIRSGELSKVVLARHLNARMDRPVNPFAVATRLIASQLESYVYVVEGLVGASPELLLRLEDGEVTSTPLAGSATSQPEQLHTEKSFEEHNIAADSVAYAFDRVGIDYVRDEPAVLDTGSIQHLATNFSGNTRGETTFADILEHLHPTAAVAGEPKARALSLIRALEGSSRGRYSGPVGWFDTAGNGEFALALRCGVVDGPDVRLHSGAGIVAGSQPGDELAETWWKLEPMLNALGVSAPVVNH